MKLRKSVLKRFIVAYNTVFRIMHGLSTRCSASFMLRTLELTAVNLVLENLYTVLCVRLTNLPIVLYNASPPVVFTLHLNCTLYIVLYSIAI